MRKLAAWIAAALIMVTSAGAGERPVVVELFTSQGCSSCPPADAFLHKLSEREDVIALAFHVDYWDYIGWKDSFADPAYTARQRAYARTAGRRMVYTPQMIINGMEHVVGNRPMDVADLIDRHRRHADRVGLTIDRTGGALNVTAGANPQIDGPLTVQLLRYNPRSTVDIKRGENAGKTLSYANVVTDLSVIGEWDPRVPLSIRAPLSDDGPVVVLVQHDDHGPVEAVARID